MGAWLIRSLNFVIGKADVNLLKPYAERLFLCDSLEIDYREGLQQRLEMAGWDEDRCWAELEKLIRDAMNDPNGMFDTDKSNNIAGSDQEYGCAPTLADH